MRRERKHFVSDGQTDIVTTWVPDGAKTHNHQTSYMRYKLELIWCTSVARKKLTEEEMEEVEARIAELQEEIEEDKINDENVDDQFEMMIQSTLTVSFIQPLN